MKLAVVTGVLMLGLASAQDDQLPPSNAVIAFKDFVQRFGRNYASEAERTVRFNIFTDNLAKIDSHNAKGLSYKLGVTAAADLTSDEFKAQYLTGFRPSASNAALTSDTFRAPQGFAEPESVDWVAKGAVTPVKNQAACGSCWTFSATGALEGATFVSRGTLPTLSEQNILDCDDGGNKCNGGSMDQAFGWVQRNGICSESDYSYKCADQNSLECKESTCNHNLKPYLASGDVSVVTDVDKTEGALEAAVAQQPVSVAIEADQAVFQHYVGGVLTNEACGSNLDHGVLAVGYGVDDGKKYWKVKNSWGTSFGEEGYIRIEKGDPVAGGECGIRKMASFPVVKSTPGPSPGPSPSPTPGPSPACADAKDKDFCKFVKRDDTCEYLAKMCLDTCGCCDADPPSFCNGSLLVDDRKEDIVV